MNQFVEIYKDLRKEGFNEYKAFSLTATHISVRGSFKDFLAVETYHAQDVANKFEKELLELEGIINGDTVRTKRQVSAIA